MSISTVDFIEDRMAVATDSTAASEDLRTLSRDMNPRVREQVACNPGTPPDVLLNLAIDYPAEVINNPAMRVHIAADPALLDTLPYDAIDPLLQEEALPTSWILVIMRHDYLSRETHLLVARHPNTPAAALRRIADDSITQPAGELACALAMHPACPADVLQALATHEDASVRAAVARHASTPAPLLPQLLGDANADVRRAVQAHPHAPSELITLLRRSGIDPAYPSTTDSSKPLTKAEQQRLCEAGPYIRERLAQASSTHPDILDRLTEDADTSVKCAAARNPNTPLPALRRLVKTSPLAVQQAVFSNPKACRHFDILMR